MKKSTIRHHLSPYSIYLKRKTTISHAFASALAPVDTYDEEILDRAILTLEQDPNAELLCVYCDKLAETWDHLINLVKNGELRGFGHQVGNLVPCCKNCNSKKGSRHWEDYVDATVSDTAQRTRVKQRLAEYNREFAHTVNVEHLKQRFPDEYGRYVELRQRILGLMSEADTVAKQLRMYIACEGRDVESASD